ncbi:hypothetical protein KI387_008828 [Taxus chinensis]|uniref:MBD domain-containing protein n=1 Tax=Taxus chinensis TaxID=29808 RepID=A0AA38CWH4_TAXCH|nr:hypothetical protein KI387_008828 [Taxus chinensis]
MAEEEMTLIKEEPWDEYFPVQIDLPEKDLTEFSGRRKNVARDIIQNPDWLPSGWATEIRTRKSGSLAGRTYKHYYEPVNGERFRSKLEVQRYLQTGSKKKPLGIPNAEAKTDLAPCGCSKPVYYHLPVVCESPTYAKHPGLYPVIYFPVIGNSEDRMKHPPKKFLKNLGDLKPISAQPHNAPSPPSTQNDILGEAFGPQNMDSKANLWHKISGSVGKKKRKSMLVSGLATPNVTDTNTILSSQSEKISNSVSNPTTPNSLASSCNSSSFNVTATKGGVYSNHIQYMQSSDMEQQHDNSPSTSPNQDQPNIPVPAAMRGRLSPSELRTYIQSTGASNCTDLVPWKPWCFDALGSLIQDLRNIGSPL